MNSLHSDLLADKKEYRRNFLMFAKGAADEGGQRFNYNLELIGDPDDSLLSFSGMDPETNWWRCLSIVSTQKKKEIITSLQE